MNNRKNGALYTGVTNDLSRRSYEHKNHTAESFTARYDIGRLVYYETHAEIMDAITREKQIKKWNRDWKINLIKDMNPDWQDLALNLNQ